MNYSMAYRSENYFSKEERRFNCCEGQYLDLDFIQEFSSMEFASAPFFGLKICLRAFHVQLSTLKSHQCHICLCTDSGASQL
jgi:hypothetical protein